MKKLFILLNLLVFCLSLTNEISAQTATDGDYRSKASGNWSAIATWQVRTSGSWVAATSAPSATNNVHIQGPHTVTIDVSLANCNDLQICVTGILACGVNTLQISGKLRAYSYGTGVVASTATGADGTFYSNQSSSTNPVVGTITCGTSAGSIKFIGNTRNITTTGEWSATGLTTSGRVEFALSSGQIGTLLTGFKAKELTVSSGVIELITGTIPSRFSPDGGSAGTGTLIIKTGARLISSESSASKPAISRTTSSTAANVPFSSFTLETGAFLELKGLTPVIEVGTFTNNGTIVYSRAGSQTLLQKSVGTETFSTYNNLSIEGGSDKTLSINTKVNGILTLTSGYLVSTSALKLTLETGATATGASASSFVKGPMDKKTNSTSSFTFPIGKGTTYRTIGVAPASATATTYTAEFFNTAPSSRTSMTAPIQAVNSLEYFDLAASPVTASTVTLQYNIPAGFCTATGDLTLAHFTGGSWIKETASATGSVTAGTVTTAAAVTSYSPFALGSTSVSSSPLPIELKSFTAINNGKTNLVQWETALEENIRSFVVEKSENGLNWSKMTETSPNISKRYTSIDNNPFKTTYYRLLSIENDGYENTSKIVSASLDKSLNVNVLSATNDFIKLNIFSQNEDDANISIIDMNGRIVSVQNVFLNAKENQIDINSSLQNGMYIVKINTNSGEQASKVLNIR